MFDDLGTLCLLGVFLLVGFMLMSRMMTGSAIPRRRGTDFRQRGPEASDYDNPEVTGRGAFGRDPRQVVPPNLRRGGSRFRPFGGSRTTGGGRVDSPEVKGRGSFGRDKR